MAKSRWPYIKPLKTKGKKVIKNVRAFDIETDGLGGEFLAVGWIHSTDNFYSNSSCNVSTSDNWENFVFNVMLLDTNSLWVAHNMGGYESLYFFDDDIAERLVISGWEVEAIGPKGKPCLLIFTHADDNQTVKVWDSYSLIRMKLDTATELFNTTYAKKTGAIDFEKETFNLDDPIHRDYLHHDVLSLQELCFSFREYFIETFGVEPGYSLPSSGVRAFRRTLEPETIYRNITSWGEDQIRKAYRGGRVIVRDSYIHKEIDKFDFNSMYPAVMREYGVPTGPDDWSPNPISDRPGFLHLWVEVPEDTPAWRCVLADDQKRYPVGVFETWTTTAEWEQAKEWGAIELEFIEGIYFDKLEKIFTPFVDICEGLRARAKAENKKSLDKLVKLVQNSLYGKFGQRRDVVSVKIGKNLEGMPIDIMGELSDYVYEVEGETTSNEIMPHWAAWITAMSRLTLVRSIDVVRDNFVYADTDSILVSVTRDTNTEAATVSVVSRRCDVGDGDAKEQRENDLSKYAALSIGSRYGQLKYEGRVNDFFTVAPKTYSGYIDDEHVFAAKGIPGRSITRDNLCRARMGETVRAEINTVRGLKTSVKYGKSLVINRKYPTPSSSTQFRWSDNIFHAPRSEIVYHKKHVRSDTEAQRVVEIGG